MPDCPNTAVLRSRLDQVLADRGDVQVDEQVIADQDQAAALGMTGSPTLLVDGVDPFAHPDLPPSLSCRLYVDEAGARAGAPSAEQLRSVLAGDASTKPGCDGLTLEGWRVAGIGSRQRALPIALRELHREVLRHFLDTGGPPDRGWIGERSAAQRLDLVAAVARLAAADLVHLDETGRVSVAYPFSGSPSGHRVRLAGGASVWAMCAIDALGIPQMAGRDAVITATDPTSGDPIRVEASGATWCWHPPGTAVLVAWSGSSGPNAVCTCGHVNFYITPEQAQADLDRHPELAGRVLDQPSAIELAGAVFADLLREPEQLRTGA